MWEPAARPKQFFLELKNHWNFFCENLVDFGEEVARLLLIEACFLYSFFRDDWIGEEFYDLPIDDIKSFICLTEIG